MREEILFLAHRLPFPPDRGDRIRAHHVLKALARLAPVHVGCLVDHARDLAHGGELARIAASYCIAERARPLALAGMEALWRGLPVSLTAFGSRQLQAWILDTLERRNIGAIYVFSGQMGQYVPAGWQGRLVVDLCDVDSAKFEAYAAGGTPPRSWIDSREGRLLRRVENDLVARAHRTLLVSEAEAQLLRSRVGNGRIEVLRNGIDAQTFDPATVIPFPRPGQGGPRFVFTGQMDYPPNISAVQRMATRILPAIRARQPAASFHVVGRNPPPEVRALARLPGCIVHGEAADMRPYLAAADAVVAPLGIARGVQNKVLEAMAMARPVILSPQAAAGIGAEDGVHFRVAQDDAGFISACLDIVENPDAAEARGREARAHVIARLAWSATLAPLADIMGLQDPLPDRRNAA